MSPANRLHQHLKDYDYSQSVNERKMMCWWPRAALLQHRGSREVCLKKKKRCIIKSSIYYFCGTTFFPSSVSLCGLQGLRVLGLQQIWAPGQPGCHHLWPAAPSASAPRPGSPCPWAVASGTASVPAKQTTKHTECVRPPEDQRHSLESKQPELLQLCINDIRSKTNLIKPNYRIFRTINCTFFHSLAGPTTCTQVRLICIKICNFPYSSTLIHTDMTKE